MKRIFALLLALACALGLAGCDRVGSDSQDNPAVVYSFHGGDGQVSVSNGTIALSEDREVFDGGDLEASQINGAQGIASFSATFYTMANGERDVIMSNSVVDETGGSVNDAKDPGSVSGDGIILGYKIESIDDLEGNLWFELVTTGIDGETRTYQFPLTLTEVSGQ